jgi:hypothetical protein
MKKELIIEIALGVVLIALAITIYFGYFYYSSCKDETCFSKSLVECKKTVYLNNAPAALLKYKITGEQSGECNVQVSLLQVKKGTIDLAQLEGLKMSCLLPLRTIMIPESNLENCKGELKEEIQSIVINRMHAELASNIGKINQSFLNISRVL